MDNVLAKIARLNEIGIALSAAREHEALCEQILAGAMELTDADGGSLYSLSEDGRSLQFDIIRNHSLNTFIGGTRENRDFPPVPPLFVDEQPNCNSVVTYCVHEGKTINIPDVYHAEGFDFSGARIFDEQQGYHTQSVLTVPLRDHHKAIIGVLQLINATGKDGHIREFDPQDQQLAESLASQAAIAISNHKLIEGQKKLFKSFIALLDDAIDAKSPYTHGHCERVPKLTMMLARAAHAADSGLFADFHLSPDQWEELEVAALLHDCGKVTTPEFVVDKATKLETIYNRIHEIRTRFEVLKRDAEIACWQQIADGGDREALLAALAAEHEQLDEDFAFVAECNIGGEFMSDEAIARLQQIGDRRWQRTLSDGLGLSWEEEQLRGEREEQLPVEEKLLADKPEHLIPRKPQDCVPEKYREVFNMAMPEYKYNRGELYNLCQRRGTLTDEDRYIINGHMIQTIIMLEELPFPPHIREVPRLAGGHHETMDGKGYPKKIKMSEEPLPARMMAIADIFEALTAADRPYKKAKTLSESLKILSFMRNDHHIDPDLFELFLRSGVYLEYAQQFLKAGQIDEVNIEDYL